MVKASSPHTHRQGGPCYQGVQSDRMKPLSKQPPMSRFVYCLLFFNLFDQCRQPAQFHLYWGALQHVFLIFSCACVRVCTCSFFVRVHIQTLTRLQPTSDRCHFYFSEDDFSGATVCSTPLPVSFNLVIRMACCVIVAPKTQALVARKKAKCRKKE